MTTVVIVILAALVAALASNELHLRRFKRAKTERKRQEEEWRRELSGPEMKLREALARHDKAMSRLDEASQRCDAANRRLEASLERLTNNPGARDEARFPWEAPRH